MAVLPVGRQHLTTHRINGEDVVRKLAGKIDIPIEKGRFIDDNYRAVAQLVDQPPHTVMHGDAHPGNVYFRNGAAGLLDWQAVRRGHPSRELAYTLVTSMTTADRRAHQRDLLDDYRRAWPPQAGPSSTAMIYGPATARAPIPYVATPSPAGGRHAVREHRPGGSAAKRRRARGSRYGRTPGEVTVIEELPSLAPND